MAKEWIVPDEDLGVDGAYFDYQELVRCKDCKWYEIAYLKRDGTADKRHKPSMCMIGAYAKPRKADWYCADGERRKDEQETET